MVHRWTNRSKSRRSTSLPLGVRNIRGMGGQGGIISTSSFTFPSNSFSRRTTWSLMKWHRPSKSHSSDDWELGDNQDSQFHHQEEHSTDGYVQIPDTATQPLDISHAPLAVFLLFPLNQVTAIQSMHLGKKRRQKVNKWKNRLLTCHIVNMTGQ